MNNEKLSFKPNPFSGPSEWTGSQMVADGIQHHPLDDVFTLNGLRVTLPTLLLLLSGCGSGGTKEGDLNILLNPPPTAAPIESVPTVPNLHSTEGVSSNVEPRPTSTPYLELKYYRPLGDAVTPTPDATATYQACTDAANNIKFYDPDGQPIETDDDFCKQD